jgi:hypothetical protein
MKCNRFFKLVTYGIILLVTLSLSIRLEAQVKVDKKKKSKKMEVLKKQRTYQAKDIQLLRKVELSKYTVPSGPKSVIATRNVSSSNGNKQMRLIKNLPAKELTVKTLSNLKADEENCRIIVKEATGANYESNLFTKMDNVIYPGALLDGNTILNGGFRPVVKNRSNAVLFTPDLPFRTADDAVIVVTRPTAAAVNQAIVEMRSKPLVDNANVPAQIIKKSTEVFSEEDLMISLDVHARSLFGSVRNTFNFSSEEKSHTFLVSITQVYYTVYMNPYPKAEDYFAGNTNIPNNLMYVSSVSYGRRGVLSIQIKDTEKAVANRFKASLNAIIASGKVELDTKWNEIINKSEITGFIFGGNPEQYLAPVSGSSPREVIAKFNEFLAEGANYSLSSPGVPLSFTIRSIDDNSLCGIEQTVNPLNVMKCYDWIVRVKMDRIYLNEAADNGDCEELFGRITAHLDPSGTQVNCEPFTPNPFADKYTKYDERYIKKECKGGTSPLAIPAPDHFLFKRSHRNYLELCEREMLHFTLRDKHYRDFPLKSDDIPHAVFVIRGDLTEYDGSDGAADYQDGLPEDMEIRFPVSSLFNYQAKKKTITQRFIHTGGARNLNRGLVKVYYTIEVLPFTSSQIQ